MAQAPTHASAIARLQAQLRAMRRADGGWPYYDGGNARIEPTCWASLALAPYITTSPTTTSPTSTSLHSFLATLQQGRGAPLTDPGSAPPNYAWNGLALFALRGQPTAASTILHADLEAVLVNARGIQLTPDPAVVKQDSRLQAWPWTDATFSWIEPTAWCVLALKRGSRSGGVTVRLAEAEALIVDRACDPGGWNYGNSQVLLQDLRPYVPTTALALLAMQDKRSEAVVVRGLTWLEAHAASEPSALALSLAAVCLHVFGRPTRPTLDALVAGYEKTAFLQNVHLMAMALYALTLARHGARAFTL